MLDHVSLGVGDLARSIAFYDAVLAPLGAVRVWTAPDAAGYGYPGCDDAFAIKREAKPPAAANPRSHLAFSAPGRATVIAFHAAAMRCGARADGAPDYHPEYGAGYFAAFVYDPDGYRIEAVFHEAPQTSLIP
jgi:catechol 2,3-dioxygenase-like lactoylglutathione lyase family enzyme